MASPPVLLDDSKVLLSRSDLLQRGYSKANLTAAVATGQLLRIRRGVYPAPGLPDAVVTAVQVGGRLACTSALATAGAWVRERKEVHIHLDRSTSRPRRPGGGSSPLTAHNRGNCTLHWRKLVEPDAANAHAVGPVDALIQVICCQPAMFAVAALDSALRLGLICADQLDLIFWHVPKRFRYLREQIDQGSESILETIVRVLARAAGLHVEIQVPISGVGRVDLLIEGRVVVETDGIEFHGPSTAARDYDRDLRLAEQGFTVIRLNYRQVMYEPERVLRAIRMAVRAHRRPTIRQ